MKAWHKLVVLALMIGVGMIACFGCKDKKKPKEPFGLTVDSLEITGEVDDAEVKEVDVDGDKWTVTDKKFSGSVDTTGKNKVEITAEDDAGNTGKKNYRNQMRSK